MTPRIEAIETGRVRVRTRQRAGEGGATRVLRTLADRAWTEPLPILCWLIDHPEGPILVDTGETPRAMQPGYFPRWHPYYRLGVRMEVGPGDGVGERLRAVGVEPGTLRMVVLTHLHTDHAGGLGDVARPGVALMVTERELADARGLAGKVRGYLPHRWPPGARFTTIDFPDGPVGPFPASRRLTDAGDVLAIPTPGHTPGHLSVVVLGDAGPIVLAGDTSYTEELMREERIDGVAPDAKVAQETLHRLATWAATEPVTYLPSHDPGSAARLAAVSPRSREGS